ncbi:SUF system Fe-S cluster assembly regulator [Halotalea alkalilenta]|uniref:SUF system Fe-S cluster assembly regulator n=1 Tax=Halotalea alkalilenta TaxID=376489 RepID=A0A172YDZ6_9GAMM|nr:SUF system Fe-S cluster assembly regulator [Halotalea alkalilenta]ANF57437.1 SUF system Fe-S cluster assembly regulator [Halotalea alkalilenta]
MLKLSKLSDYAGVVMAQIARHPESAHAAPELAASVGLPRPTVSKTLKLLQKAGLLISRRGVQGGYLLARPARSIRVSDIIEAIEGPVAMTACSHGGSDCDLAATCGVADNWQRVSVAIRQLLDSVTLEHLAQREPLKLTPPRAETAVRRISESLLVSDARVTDATAR